MKPENTFTDLGMANAWITVPEIITSCVEKKHSPKKTGVGRCLTEVRCELCGYKYLIDSSD